MIFRSCLLAVALSTSAPEPVLSRPLHPVDDPPADGGRQPAWFLRGLVLELGTGQPLEGVMVTVTSADAVVLEIETDERGLYLGQLPSGRYQLVFAYPGFVSSKLELVVDGDLSSPPVFLEPREDRKAAMVVETRRAPREMNLEIVTAAEIERTPGTFGDPIRALESLPNVARPRFLDGALVVRGAEPNNTAVLFDGHQVPFLFHFGFWKSVINPYFVDTVRFYPGGMPSSYGNVLQAVVDVTSRQLPPDRVHGVADINLADSSLVLTAPLLDGRLSVGAAGRFSYLSLMILGASAVFNSGAYLFPRYADYQIKVDSTIRSGHFSALFFGAKDGISLGDDELGDGSAETRTRFDAYQVDPSVPYLTQFDHLHLNYDRSVSTTLTLLSSTLVGRDLQISVLPFNEDLLRLAALTRLERWVVGERAEATWTRSEQLTARAGLDFRYSRALLTDLSELWSSSDVPVPDPEVKPVLVAALYARAEWMPRSSWLLIPEIRGTFYRYNGRNEPLLEPRITLRYPLTSRVTGKASGGLFSQLPEEREYSQQGNPELKMMKALQASIGCEVDLPLRAHLESTIFASRMRDLTLSQTDLVYQQTETGLTYRMEQVFYTGNGWGYGGEITVKRPIGDEFTGSLSYAYTRSLRDNDGDLIPGDYDQPHTLTLMGTVRLRHRWVASARFRFGSGQPYTPLYGAWFPTSDDYLPISGELNSARHKPYHQLDVRLDRTILRPRWRLNLYLDIQNVYMARNPILEYPNWNYTGAGSFIWIPIVPTMGVRGEF